MDTVPGSIKKLFEKYLKGDCSAEEAGQLQDYFGSSLKEEQVRQLIRDALDAPVEITDATYRALDHTHSRLQEMIEFSPSVNRRWARFPVRNAAIWLLLLLSAGAFLLYRGMVPKLPEKVLAEIATAAGERRKLVLDDGSTVWLNAASKLRYPETFAADQREVILEGEAYFDVTKDAARPFLIRSGALQTTVLGTSFNIKAYGADKKMSVAVVTGKVKVVDVASDSEISVKPNEQVVFDKEAGALKKEEGIVALGVASWKEGQLHFINTTFSEVTATLQRSHNVRISFDAALENCPVVLADFDEKEPIEKILNMLLLSVNGKVLMKGDNTFHLVSSVSCQ